MKTLVFPFCCMLLLSCLAVESKAQINVTLTRTVATGNDDAEQRVSTGAIDLTSSDLEIMTDGANNQLIGIRFTNLTLPQGITIDSAFIQFANKGDKTPVNGNATIRGELSLNASTYVTTVNNISSRSTTSASVSWPGSTDTTWSNTASVLNFQGRAQRTPDLKSLIQEIVNQGSWTSGNALAFVLNGTGVRNANSYNGSASFAPRLTVYYTLNSYTPSVFPLTANNIWKFSDNGLFPGSNWTQESFDDAAWVFKQGPLGYGSNQQTTVSFGANANDKHITTYFRNKFTMSNTSGFDTLILKLRCDDGAVVYVNGVEVFRKNMPAGTIDSNTLALSEVTGADEDQYTEFRVGNTLVNGINVIAVELHQFDSTTLNDDAIFDLSLNAKRVPMSVTNFPIAKNSEWYYLDDGTDQGTNWRQPSFYEGNWNYGPGKLGYSDAPTTTLSFGPNSSNKYITYYFRKKFNVPSVATLADTLLINVLRDDAAVVYINGTEVLRSNIQDTGVINYLTKSLTIVDGAAESVYNEFRIPKNLLIDGINTLAVEVHQRDSISSDLGFDLEFKEDPRQLYLTVPAQGSYVTAGANTLIQWVSIPTITTVSIELSTNNGATWTPIATDIPAASRSFVWSVPNINASSSLLRIIDSANTSTIDTTDGTFWIYPSVPAFNPCSTPTHIGCFTSVQPMAQTQVLRYPDATHNFQRIAKTGDALTLGGTVGANNDFTAFIPSNGSSKTGTLSVNHETDPGGVSMFHIQFNDTTGLWKIDSSGAVDFTATGLVKTIRNCSGGVTPWETVITSEESYNTGDANSDGYTDIGWHVEIDPKTRQVMDYNNDGIKDKLWQMGRMNHENIVLASDSVTAYFAEDGGSSGLYKFIANQKMQMDSGTLYVLQRNGTSGTWIPVPNTSQAQCNTVSSVVSGLGATNFNGAEDVEINPVNGMVYFTSKGNSLIYRFNDNGSTVSNFENYVGNNTISYSINYGSGTQSESWGTGIDNLVFDDLGNLWAQQDGSRNHIWVIRPDHTPFNPKVELFATTPAGSEPTGLTFTPDYKYGFISFQHPGGNTATLTDVANQTVQFNTHTTIVFANKQFLGPLAALPVELASFYLVKTAQNGVKLIWSTMSETNNDRFLIERSLDGRTFQVIGEVKGSGNTTTFQSYSFTDIRVPQSRLYYRIRQRDFDGATSLSPMRTIDLSQTLETNIRTYPNPFSDQLSIEGTSAVGGDIVAELIDFSGKTQLSDRRKVEGGSFTFNLSTLNLPKGAYVLRVTLNGVSTTTKLVK